MYMMCCVANAQLFSLQRAGLHPGLQRQGGCRRLALGLKGKCIIICTQRRAAPAGLDGKGCHRSGVQNGHRWHEHQGAGAGAEQAMTRP